jgi:hypothetical protein
MTQSEPPYGPSQEFPVTEPEGDQTPEDSAAEATVQHPGTHAEGYEQEDSEPGG